jgi:hypothetical protein
MRLRLFLPNQAWEHLLILCWHIALTCFRLLERVVCDGVLLVRLTIQQIKNCIAAR